MKSRTRSRRGLGPIAATVLVALVPLACSSDDDSKSTEPASFAVDTTRLCALVPARDAELGNTFPPPPPVEVCGTDLGWTYEVDGRIPILFGDTWQRIDICPVQTNDDSLGELHLPASDWPGFDATGSIPDSQCLDITYEIDEAGTAFAPITLHRWDGVAVPLGPLNTPVVGFYDGQREWAVFIIGGGQRCTPAEAASGAVCPTTSRRRRPSSSAARSRDRGAASIRRARGAATARKRSTSTSPSASVPPHTSRARCSSRTST